MRIERHVASVTAAILALIAGAAGAADAPRAGIDWPGFRGIQASGIADAGASPLEFDTRTGRGIGWMTKVPGLGHSSPAIWGDLLCVTTAVAPQRADLKVGLYGDIESTPDDALQQWKVYCLDKNKGAIRWERTAKSGRPRIRRHPKATHANSTLAMDSMRVVALFGSEGLFAYDHSGKLLWSKDLGVLDSGFFEVPGAQWGFGSSPMLHDGTLVVQADVQKGSFLAAFDAATGKEIWRTGRTDVPTWSTPNVHTLAGAPQVVVNGWRHMGGYDLATGKEVWRLHGRGDIPVPTPVIGEKLIYLTSAHGGRGTFAVKADARGDITPAAGATTSAGVAWSAEEAAYMQTPLLYRGHLYVCGDNGVLTVFDPVSGARVYQQRLGQGTSGFTASAVASNGRVYFTSEDGEVYVVSAGPRFELLATSTLGETALATPALSGERLFFRTRDHVIAVEPGGR